MTGSSRAPTSSEFVGENVEKIDVWRRGEELIGFVREGFSDRAAKMGLPCRVVRERVDDAEREGAESHCEPRVGAGFRLDEWQCGEKEFLDRALLAGLGLQPYQQCLG